MKRFNTTGLCIPARHYMVNIDDKLEKIKQMVDEEDYFVINRSRQYGKTTTLRLLESYLSRDYAVISLDFQKMDNTVFETGQVFARSFAEYLVMRVNNTRNPIKGLNAESIELLEREAAKENSVFSLMKLFDCLCTICEQAEKPVVLMIDEVDSASNNQVFLDFLAQLRLFYLERDITPTFQSVILAGVHDIRHLKRKFRPEEQHKINSPWNIAVPFEVDMSLSESGIAGMLSEYEQEHSTGMDVQAVAKAIREYTSGYPFLVSLICKIIDEKLMAEEGWLCGDAAWSENGVSEAVKRILLERNTLFESLTRQVESEPKLKTVLYAILFQGKSFTYNAMNDTFHIANMLGFIKAENSRVVVSNRIFEMMLYDLFLSEELVSGAYNEVGNINKNQ